MERRTLAGAAFRSRRRPGLHGDERLLLGPRRRESLATLERALELGIDFLDTAEMYGRSRTKTARPFPPGPAGQGRLREVGHQPRSGRPASGGSTARPRGAPRDRGEPQALRTDVIDLYYCTVSTRRRRSRSRSAPCRPRPRGKIRFIACPRRARRRSSARRRRAGHRIADEYSLWSRDPEDGVLAACRRLASLRRLQPARPRFLTGQIRRFEDLAPDDYRRTSPRFQARTSAGTERLAHRRARAREAARRANSRSPGCSRRARTWCRSPAPSPRVPRGERGGRARDALRAGLEAIDRVAPRRGRRFALPGGDDGTLAR